MTVKIFKKLVPRTFMSERKFQIFIQESAFDFIPRGMKKPVYKVYLKDELYEKCGDSAFLFPEDRMFPVKNVNTGLYDCRLIQYAVIRAYALRRISHDFDHYLDVAIACFREHGCRESEIITLVDEDNRDISLITFLRILDEYDGKMEIDIPVVEKLSREEMKQVIPHYKGHYKKYKRLAKTATKRV